MDEFEKVAEAMKNEDTEVLTEQAALDSSEQENEPVAESVQADEITDTEDVTAEQIPEVTDEQIPETTDEQAELAAEQSPKKKLFLQKPIIIACCIFLAALIAFGGFMLVTNIMTPKLESIWVMNKVYLKGSEKDAQTVGTKENEAVYYQFKDNGDFVYRTGTVTQYMKWSYSDASGKLVSEKTKNVSVYVKGYESNATQYKWACDGNAFSEKKLTLQAGTDTVQVYKFTAYNGSELPEYTMKADSKFKADKELLGNWYDSKSKQTLTFNQDGTYVLDVNKYLTQKGNYSYDAKKKTIKLKFVDKGTESDTGDLPYSFSKGKLVLAGYNFTKK